jgi:hypothetical protein
MSEISANWHEHYLGKPWDRTPNPPQTYNCGELIRAVHLDLFGIDSPAIAVSDAGKLKDCIRAMDAEYGLYRIIDGRSPREFDVVFLGKGRFTDHCGIMARTTDGLLVLHCMQGAGTCLDSLTELTAMGFTKQFFARHPLVDAALAAA